MASENEFPTIRHMRDTLSMLIDRGFGDLPVQLVIAPDSTIQALARAEDPNSVKPAIMLEFPVEARAFGVPFITTDRLTQGRGMPTVRDQ